MRTGAHLGTEGLELVSASRESALQQYYWSPINGSS